MASTRLVVATLNHSACCEHRLAAGLSSPHVLVVHEAGVADGLHFIVMELAEEGSAADRLKAERLDFATATRWIRRCAAGLDVAHQAGIIHRDIKPSNILIKRGGVAKIGDFGLAKIRGGCPQITRSGVAVGSPSFMSPEQVLGVRKLDARSDVYSLGATYYALLTGHGPFDVGRDRSAMSVMHSHVHEQAPDPAAELPGLPLSVRQFILRCLEKDPERRFADGGECYRALEAIDIADPRPRRPRRRALALSIAGVATVLTTASVFMTMDAWNLPVSRENGGLAAIDAGSIDCVVVYKVDRLSRSLMDFARIVETFERHNVSFVSVTQHFNTTNSMGRLTLNILLSLAQFERAIIGERIRDKIAASRQKGKWTGGAPILGYDVDRSNGGPKLVVNATEAARGRAMFELYVERGSLLSVAGELRRRGWMTKRWMTRGGKPKGGLAFDKCNLYSLLTNVLYVGKVRYRRHVFAGEHEAIIPDEWFRRLQTQLQHNGRSGGKDVRNKYGALLRGLLHCKACGRVMTHTFSARGNNRYRYYTCTNAIKNGWDNCPTKSLPAAEIERAVVDQIRCIADDAELLRETLVEAQRHVATQSERLEVERKGIERGLHRSYAELRRLVTAHGSSPAGSAQIAYLNDQIRQAEHRLAQIAEQVADLERDLVTDTDLAAAFADFDIVWRTLSPREQAQLVHLLVARVEFDVEDSTIEVSFYPTGIKALSQYTNGMNAFVRPAQASYCPP